MAVHIVVCIKAVMIEAPRKANGRSVEGLALNPFDGSALESALRIREERGGTVTALTMGPGAAGFVLREAMAMGVDRGILLSDPALAGSDTLATSTALGAALRRLMPFDLVIFGTRTSDSDTGQVGPQTAALLGIPLVTWANRMGWGEEEKGLQVERRADGFVETFEVSPPAALTMDPRSVAVRDLDLAGIETAFQQRGIETWSLGDVGLSADDVGLAGSGTVVVSWKRVARERKCRFLTGTAAEQVDALVAACMDAGLIGE